MRRDAPLGYRLIGLALGAVVRLARGRIDAQGLEHVPEDGGAVLTWNHTSHVDVVLTALALLRRTGRWARLLAVRDLWGMPLLRGLLRLGRCVPVDRQSGAGRVEAYGRALDALRGGDLVMVAPEGTISASLDLLPFRTGAVRMAQATGVPVVPTASWGSHRLVTTGRPPSLRRAWRFVVVVRVGAPLHVGPEDDPVVVTDQLRRRTQQLLAAARGDHPSGAPPGRDG